MDISPKHLVLTKSHLTAEDLSFAQQAIRKIMDYAGDLNQYYNLYTHVIPPLNRVLRMRLERFVNVVHSQIDLSVTAFYPEEIQRQGFRLGLNLYGTQTYRILPLTLAEEFLLDDAVARPIAHEMITYAAVTRWGL